MTTRRRRTAAAAAARASPGHWPSQPLVDGAANAVLERWAQLFAICAAHLAEDQEAAAYGPGILQAVMGQRLAEPVPGRLARDGRMRDEEVRRLRHVLEVAVKRLHYDADWFARAIDDPTITGRRGPA